MTGISLQTPEILERRALLAEAELARRDRMGLQRDTLIGFIQHVAPWFILEEVHILICQALQRLAFGEVERLMVFMPPRTGKSQIASIFLPAWYLGHFADHKVMQASHSKELAVDFGRQVKYLLEMPEYQELFPRITLKADNRSAGRWGTNAGGVYAATGVGGAIAGKGFHLGVADDLISEQDKDSDAAKQFVKKWWGPGFYTRRQPEKNSILYMATRWSLDDPAGYLLGQTKERPDEADHWEVLKVPAILDANTADLLNEASTAKILLTPRHPKRYHFIPGDSFAPRRWPLRELHRSRGNMGSRDFSALYQQSPVEEEGNIFKRKWWRKWPGEKPPKCEYMVTVYDTAFEEGQESDFSARTTWGIFWHEDRERPQKPDKVVEMFRPMAGGRYNAILLERWQDKVEFPTLRKLARDHYDEWKPDRVLVEKKASGHSLIQELRRNGVPVVGVGKGKRESKLAMYNAAAVPLEQGTVWYMNRRWADEVIDHCSLVPYGEHDDLGDTVAIALLFLRRTFHLQLPGEEDEDEPVTPKRRGYGG